MVVTGVILLASFVFFIASCANSNQDLSIKPEQAFNIEGNSSLNVESTIHIDYSNADSGSIPNMTKMPAEEDKSTYRRRTPFVPLDNPSFITSAEATYLSDDDLILGLYWKGASKAYPIRMLRFHHIINDKVNGKPILITY